jgi:hypothetical protein
MVHFANGSSHYGGPAHVALCQPGRCVSIPMRLKRAFCSSLRAP